MSPTSLLIATIATLTLAPSAAMAASGGRVGGFECLAAGDGMFMDGYDDGATVAADPTLGSGGPSGSSTRVISVGFASREFFLRVPPGYTPTRAYPLLIVLHGSAPPDQIPVYASATRDSWSASADASGYIVIAPEASGANGGWEPATDYNTIGAAINDTESRYNIDRHRILLWGFSAGGHVAHDLALTNTSFFAAYAVSAGVLDAYAGAGAPAAAARHIPVDIHIGTSDPLASYAQADYFRFLNAGWTPGVDLNYVAFNGGHTYTTGQTADIWKFLCPWTVVP
jgi:dienelactone hydrolase